MIIAVILVTLLIFLLIYHQSKVPRGLPPGSFGWPVLGTLPPQNKRLYEHLTDLRKKYGDIFTTKWGSRVMVIICDPRLAKKALSHPDIQGKSDFYTGKVMTFGYGNCGLLSNQGSSWADTRRFVLTHLKDLGMGKAKMMTFISDEAEAMVNYLTKKNLNEPVEMDIGIDIAVVNIIWMFMVGTRNSSDDTKMVELTKLMKENFRTIQTRILILDIFPWLLNFKNNFIFDNIFRTEQILHFRRNFTRIIHEIIDQHRRVLDPDHPRDLIDFYLLKIEKEKDNPDTIFKEDCNNLVILLKDMYLAGYASTANSLRWTCLYLATAPEVQRRVQEELKREVPHGRLPSLEEKARLPYLNATILEIQRRTSSIATGSIHCTTADVNLEGYFLPKDIGVMTSIEMFHYDPELWEKPYETHPEHFLDSEGGLVGNRSGFMPFQLGPRQCAGEAIARATLFFFTAALVQNFEISAPPGVELNLNPLPGSRQIGRPPLPFKIMLRKRV